MSPPGFARSAKTVLFCENATDTSEKVSLNQQCKSNSPKRGYAFARRLPTQMRFECVFYVLRCTLARPLPIQLRFPYAQMCSRSTAVHPNAFSMCSSLLSLDICGSKRLFYMLKCALARRSSMQTRVLCAQMRSRSTLFNPNAFIVWKVYLGLSMA